MAKLFLKTALKILRDTTDINIYARDVVCKFTRRNYEDILTKANVLNMMLGNDKIAPRLAFNSCGLFTDAEEAFRESEEAYSRIVEAGKKVEAELNEDSEKGEENAEGNKEVFSEA